MVPTIMWEQEKVPKELIDEMNLAAMDSQEKEEEVGYNLSKNLLKDLLKIHNNYHLMTHNRFELCKRLIEESKK